MLNISNLKRNATFEPDSAKIKAPELSGAAFYFISDNIEIHQV
jgi:hypothetical protein